MAEPKAGLDDIESREGGTEILVQLTRDGDVTTCKYEFVESEAADLEAIEGCDCSLEPHSVHIEQGGEKLLVESECEECGVEYTSVFEATEPLD